MRLSFCETGASGNLDAPDKSGYPDLSDLSGLILDVRISPEDKYHG